MKRWLFNIAAGVSLLLGLLVIVVWIRSESSIEQAIYRTPITSTPWLAFAAGSQPGAIIFLRALASWTPEGKDAAMRMAGPTSQREAWSYMKFPFALNQNSPNLPSEQLWFEWSAFESTVQPGVTVRQAELRVPDWFLILISLVLPTIWLIKFRRQQRRKLIGCCSKCGYDLRATPDRCPECGTPAHEVTHSPHPHPTPGGE